MKMMQMGDVTKLVFYAQSTSVVISGRQRGDKVATLWQDKRTIAVLLTIVQPVMGAALHQNDNGN